MLIRNKEAYNVKKKNKEGEFIIYENYEDDVIKAISVFLSSDLRVVFLDEVKKIIYFEVNNTMWQLSDNGGEFNISPVNAVSPISIPYTHMNEHFALNPATMGYRLAVVIKNFENFKVDMIDWDNKYGNYQSDVILKLRKGSCENLC